MAKKRSSMALKLTVAISVAVCIIFAVVSTYGYRFSKKILLNNIEERAQEVLAKNVNEVEMVLSNLAAAPKTIASMVTVLPHLPETTLESILKNVAIENPGAYGFCVAYEPYAYDPSIYYFGPYVWMDGTTPKYQRLGAKDYDYFEMEWFKRPKELGTKVWSEPYYDEGATGVLMTTFSFPFYSEKSGEKKFLGVTTADVTLAWLQKLMADVKLSESGYAFLVSKTGAFIAHPRKDLIIKETMFSVAEKFNRPYLAEAGKLMTSGKSGSINIISAVTDKPARLFFAPITQTGWSMGIVIMESELLAKVTELHREIMVIGIFGILLIITGVILIAKKMSRPLEHLTAATLAFAGGDMNVADIDIHSGDEIEALNNAFNDLKKRLREKMEELKEYNLTLEQKVSDRTKEIAAAMENLKHAQEQLIQQEKLASLGGMAAGIAHEIKNPLNFVTNFAEVTTELVDELSELLKGTASEECLATLKDIRENVVKINEHGKRADSIVKGMLMHSRGKAGEKQEVDIAALLIESINLAYHGFRAKDRSFNVTIDKDIDANLPKIMAIPQDISRVFLNITDNAFYSVNEKAKLKKSSYSPEFHASAKLDKDSIVIKLRDNGLGVPASVSQKVFDPFFTTKPTGSGTGLGLSISYDIIVKQHNGSLELDTKADEYAEFTIKLPLKRG